ncbi:MAG: hydroxymethylbilane synthase [Leptospirales bacterium]|nr:hydroxymethylbilane synthase [Leptospirales bacterium]
MNKKIKIGTRGSELALWQAKHVSKLLGEDKTELVIIKTAGDKIQNVSFNKMEGKGFFTKELEEALLNKKIDLAVHSLKDLPTDEVGGLRIAAIPERGDHHDVIIMHKNFFIERNGINIKKESIIGTSSARRMAQLKAFDAAFKIEALRGNVNTRLNKLKENKFDAIVMAKAAIDRINLSMEGLIVQVLSEDIFLPAPAQGALGIQVRSDDEDIYNIVRKLNHTKTETLVTAERSFLKNFGGGCHVPLGAYAMYNEEDIILKGVIASQDGSSIIKESATGKDPESVGLELSLKIKSQGAENYL